MRGFTLIELLVVISTIAILLSILMPILGKARSIAYRIRCSSNLRQVNLAFDLYVNDYDNTYPCSQDPVSIEPYYWLWMGRGWRSFVEPYLGGNVDANNPSVLFCPSDRTAKEKWESTSYAYSMTFYHSPEQIDSMKDKSDTYSNPQSSIPQKSFNVAYLSEKVLVGEWLSNHLFIEKDGGWWCWEGARNYLFADGQVLFLEAKQIHPANDNWPDAHLTINGIKGRDISD